MFKLDNPTKANPSKLLKGKILSLEEKCQSLMRHQHKSLYRRTKQNIDGMDGIELSRALDEASQQLERIMQKPMEELFTASSATDEDKCRLLATLSFAIHSLSFVLLKTQGIPTKTHAVKTELDRIKTYFGKVDPAKNKLRIDKEASKRFVKHGIGSGNNQVQVKRKNAASESNVSKKKKN